MDEDLGALDVRGAQVVYLKTLGLKALYFRGVETLGFSARVRLLQPSADYAEPSREPSAFNTREVNLMCATCTSAFAYL